MRIRRANKDDLNSIEQIYDLARQYMRSTGNHAQWINGYPSAEIIKNDLENEVLFVVEDVEIQAVFAMIQGEDPTYLKLDGDWLNDQPYATLHRIASKGTRKGFFNLIVTYAWSNCPNLRIDTHQNNAVMRHLIEKNGFAFCGIIFLGDGTPRLAYQKVSE